MRPVSPLLIAALLAIPVHAAEEEDVVELPPPVASPTPPPADPSASVDTVDGVASLLRAGLDAEAERLARRVGAAGEDRAAASAWLAAGLLAADAGRPEEALAALDAVDALGGPLRPWAAWLRAEQLYQLGDWERAAATAGAYVRTWPRGAHRVDCVRLEAMASAHLGDADTALALALAWDREVEHASILEPVELALAAWEAEHAPAEAVARLRRLATVFSAPTTADTATALLDRLAERGVDEASLPDDPDALRRRAISLRDSGLLEPAWALFTELEARAASDPALGAWVEQERGLFQWRTRQWTALLARYEADWATKPDADVAWSAFRAASRGGLHAQAVDWAERGLRSFASDRTWRRNTETVARELLVAGAFDQAVALFDDLSTERGSTGERNAYYAAFAELRAGRTREAVRRFDALLDDGVLPTEVRYWRAQALAPTDPDAAARDRAWILEHDPSDWYATLLRSAPGGPDGQWPGSHELAASLVEVSTRLVSPQGLGLLEASALVPGLPWRASTALLPDPALSAIPVPREEHAATFARFAKQWAGTWPELAAIEDLARVGLTDLSGPAFRAWRRDWLDAWKRRDRDARQVAEQLSDAQWRALYVFTGDHYDAARALEGTWRVADPDTALELERLAMPLAYRRVVWRESARWGLDPLLVLALMRAESIYDPHAVSRVGARGPMQIMPRTGALVARHEGDAGFSPGDLHEPELAVRYGVRYLAMLLRRFDGVLPLAIASYNGGPHNVSSWLVGTGMDVPMDVLVDSIPFGETRRYVRKVMGFYARYLALYRPGAPPITVAPTPRADRPEVVDF